MKLSTEQISYIENYTSSFEIQYYEIYREILDHMILSVENIMETENSISFENAVVKAKEEDFGKLGFRGMMKEKSKLAHKRNAKENHNRIKTYFTFPKIALTVLVFVTYFLFLSMFDNPVLANFICINTVGFFGLFQMFYARKFRKFENKYILKTQVLNSTFALSYSGLPLANSFIIIGKESIDFNHIFARLFMTLIFTFSFISVLVYIEVRKKTIIELKNEIFA